MARDTATSLSDKCVITCACSGVLTQKKHCPAIPYTIPEYVAECTRAYEAGAAVVHLHARDDNGAPNFRAQRYQEIRDAVSAACPILINFSTGAIGLPMEQRVGHITGLRPHIGALNMGSMNYSKYSAERKTLVFDLVFANPFADIIYLLKAMNQAGVKPELECFDTGHVNSAPALVDMGILRPPLDFSLIVGVLGGIPGTARHLAFQVDQLPPGSTWKVIGISREQWKLSAAALALGGNVRVGLEDNYYLPSGEMARSNGDLVAQAAALCRAVGREPATIEEARAILQLDTYKPEA
ncbi:MAG: 3-keto-5-aminohexanoate cleavage protein [Deltaproteobacteria bacterium]|nr:3-keto-5-aminohexanoate cleavage protein [Deltaproteobacteria bacterium]